MYGKREIKREVYIQEKKNPANSKTIKQRLGHSLKNPSFSNYQILQQDTGFTGEREAR